MNHIDFDLLANGYLKNSQTGVYYSESYTDIEYNDGDESETRIFNAIKNAADIDSLSDELETHCIDWPSTYHLSKRRGNLLRPFSPQLKNKTILEIGSGMGPITRVLGESEAWVLALEGTSRRSHATRLRTRDLKNVSVISEKFEDFRTDIKFDVITVIGVLEYSNLYSKTENPHLDLLEKCFDMLKEDGSLILAIENKLGLKYFTGAREDHVGIPMYGLENRYDATSVRTFGKVELNTLLARAGFDTCQFNAPLPDYKLTTSVISQVGFDDQEFSSVDLIRDSFMSDPQLPPTLAFTPEHVLSSLHENELSLDFANSFLVIANKSSNEILQIKELGWHFSTNRRKAYCNKIEFVRVNSKHIEVRKSKLSSLSSNKVLIQEIVPTTLYLQGNYFRNILELLLSTTKWKHLELKELLLSYKKFLIQFQKKENFISGEIHLEEFTLDFIPRNIVIKKNGEWEAFDSEWQSKNPVDLRYLLFRTVISMQNFSLFAEDELGSRHSPKSLHDLFCFLLDLQTDEKLILEFIELEVEIQKEVSGLPVEIEDFVDLLNQPMGRRRFNPLHPIIISAEGDSAIAERDSAIAERDSAIAERDSAIAERDSISNSTIWKFFGPYRKINRFIGRI
jgi:2-polyprenyl-3-methyl-5-hydroxy-6-metoxy-1,4-benzoquinol methylase